MENNSIIRNTLSRCIQIQVCPPPPTLKLCVTWQKYKLMFLSPHTYTIAMYAYNGHIYIISIFPVASCTLGNWYTN